MRQHLTEITILLDSSGSMYDCINDTQQGLRAFIEKQRSVPGCCDVNVYEFSLKTNILKEKLDIYNDEDITKLLVDYKNSLGGGTALYDAVFNLINNVGKKLSDTPEQDRPSCVNIVIITDGEENSSIETNLLHLKEMIKHQKEVYNWTFTFIGADISTADAVSMNIDAATSVSISKSKILQGMEAASIKLCSYRNSRNVADLHYSNEERSQLS